MLTSKQRKELFKEKKGNRSAIARAAGVSVSHVRYVLDGLRRSPSIERMVALVLEMPVDEVFEPRVGRRLRKPTGAAA